MTVNVATFITSAAGTNPDRIAVTSMGEELTYAALDQASTALAHGLRASGLELGDRIALSAPNINAFVISYFGILKAGGVVVPFNVMNKRSEIQHILQDSGARGLICFEGSPELPLANEAAAAIADVPGCTLNFLIPAGMHPAPPAPFAPFAELMQHGAAPIHLPRTEHTDLAVILYTSGTTGRPKGVELTHSNLMFTGMIVSQQLRLTKEDRMLLPLPLFHVMGQCVMMLSAFYSGATVDLVPRFDPKACVQQMARDGTTVFAGVPTMYSALVMVGAAMPDIAAQIGGKLRICLSGASPFPEDMLRRFESLYPGATVWEGYGLTETTSIISFASLDAERKIRSVGKPAFGTEVRIIDEDGNDVRAGEKGELISRSPLTMRGYRNNPAATKAAFIDGWFRTGDVALRDEEGYIFIVDRKKDVVIRGGYNVYPTEVENVLVDHPAVAMAAVVGRPDQHLGEEVIAFVSLAHEAKTDEAELVAWCKERLANYKYPRQVFVRPALPLNGTGKILKTVLRSELQDRQPA